jgi:hypothetical protein
LVRTTGTIAPQLRDFRSYKLARAFVRSLKLKSCREWRQFYKGQILEKGKLPSDIPANPREIYKNSGWIGFGDWLGTKTIAPRLRTFRSFKKAREFARALSLKSQREWYQFCRGELTHKETLPPDIPTTPSRTYKTKGWKGYSDWLGTR